MRRRDYVKALLIAGTCSIGLSGCGSPGDRPELGEVTGTIMMDGEPLPNAKVVFHPSSDQGGRRSVGVTGDDGRYELMYMQGADTVYGAKVGPHTVIISAARNEDDPGGEAEETVPERYRGRNSELTAIVESGDNDELNFDLESQ